MVDPSGLALSDKVGVQGSVHAVDGHGCSATGSQQGLRVGDRLGDVRTGRSRDRAVDNDAVESVGPFEELTAELLGASRWRGRPVDGKALRNPSNDARLHPRFLFGDDGDEPLARCSFVSVRVDLEIAVLRVKSA